MSEAAFARMHQRLFARLGREALLRGEPTRAIVEHGVAVSGEYGQVVAYRSFATLASADAPKAGDSLVIDGKSYIVDSIDADDGYTTSCVLR